MNHGKSNDDLGDFLTLRGITEEWLQERCEELRTDSDDASTVLELLAEMISSGIALPPIAANMVSTVLLELAKGKDARGLVGTAPTRGRPTESRVKDRNIQAGACLALMELAGFERGQSVSLLALTMPKVEREVQDIIVPELNNTSGDWDHLGYLIDLGAETLNHLCSKKISDIALRDSPISDSKLKELRAKIIEFISYRKLR
jgi:hypothetical protein